jgi:purine-nucleoside phosphorylase
VLLPGDPLRAKFIAETFLENPVCYSEVRGMFGFTGTYKGKPVSVQGTGMGQPSMSIYATERFKFYNVQTAIRVGTAGSISPDVHVRDVVLASSASTDSGIMAQRFGPSLHYAPTADWDLLLAAHNAADKLGISHVVAPVASQDLFYEVNENWKVWAKFGVKALEMETAELYTLAALFGRKALGILTVSDHMITGEATSAQDRQTTFTNMMKIALEAAVSQ